MAEKKDRADQSDTAEADNQPVVITETVEMSRITPVSNEASAGDDVEATRAQIEQTRSEMSSTIDAIKEKLNPQTLMDQAKDTVSVVTADAVQQAKDTVREVSANLAETAKSTIHDVTADVVGQTKTTVHAVVTDVTDHAKDAARGAVSGAVSGAVGEAKEAVSSAVGGAKEVVVTAVGGAAHTAKEASSSMLDFIKQNPVPMSLMGIGLGWLFMNSRKHGTLGQRYPEVSYRYGYGSYDADEGGSSVRETLSSAKDKVGDVAGHAKDRVSDVAGRATEGLSEVAGTVQDKASQLTHQARDKASELTHQARDKASQLTDQAQYKARAAVGSLEQMVQDNPLAVGAMALVVGAVVGMTVPGTSREQRLMGETRDRLVERAGETAQDLTQKAKSVAQEALTAAKETAQQEAQNQGLTPNA